MISDAFKSAYVNETGQQMQGIGTLTSSAKNIGTAVLGALGFSGALGEGLMAKGAQHALAGKIGGVGGSIMLATMEQKAATAKAAQQVSQAVELDQSQQVEASKTVFETLMNKKGMVETSFGEIDPNSPLGQKIKETTEEDDKKKDIDPKQEQLDIINKNNPAPDDYHTWIRKKEDIKTFEEAMQDEDSFVWGDYSKKDAERDFKKGTITVYSSHPIKQGTFVSTSKIQAEEYAGGPGSKVHSVTVPLDEIAWINGDEGQYARRNK